MTRKPTRRFGAELSEQGLKEHSQHEEISISGQIRGVKEEQSQDQVSLPEGVELNLHFKKVVPGEDGL